MNREQAKKMLPIIQAFADGADVQYHGHNGRWFDWPSPNFTTSLEVRIKPKPLEGWATVYSFSDGREVLGSIYGTQGEAAKDLACSDCRIVPMREVTE